MMLAHGVTMRSFAALPLALLAGGCAAVSPSYLARVNDETIAGKELRREFARSHYALEKILGDESEVRRYLERLVDRRLFVQEAYRVGLHEADEVREAVRRFRSQKLLEALLEEEVEAPSVATDAEVKAVHDALGEPLEVRQVVVATREEAEEIRARVVAGADMEKLARERSLTPSSRQGGMIVVSWGGDEAYEKSLPGLADGEVSPVFRSSSGWEVARVERRRPAERPPLEKVEAKIRQILERRKRAAREEELYRSLWARYEARLLDCAPTLEVLQAPAAPDARPCATWRGGSITASTLAARVKLDQASAMKERWPALREALLEDLVNRAVLTLEAEARGYAARPEIVEKVRAHQDDLVEAKLYRDVVTRKIEATETDAMAYFEAHRDAFVEDARYELAQVVVETSEAAAAAEGRIRSGEPFAEVAAALSLDRRSAEDGGRVGVVERRQLKEEFAALAALGEGEVSAPIRSQGGYHLVKVLSIVPARPLAFEEARESARVRALDEKRKAEIQRWVGQLRAAARIELNDAGIRAYARERARSLRQGRSQEGQGPQGAGRGS